MTKIVGDKIVPRRKSNLLFEQLSWSNGFNTVSPEIRDNFDASCNGTLRILVSPHNRSITEGYVYRFPMRRIYQPYKTRVWFSISYHENSNSLSFWTLSTAKIPHQGRLLLYRKLGCLCMRLVTYAQYACADCV